MIDIAGNIGSLKKQLPPSVSLVAVSKTKPVSDILEAYRAGQRIFGENRVQELLGKKDLLPDDIKWHFLGHLQSNKVKFIVPFISLIHSVDSYKLLSAVNSEALKINTITDCLLQIHIAQEETKFGFSIDELAQMTESREFANMKNVRICGVMGMATYTADIFQIRKEFIFLKGVFNDLKNRYFTSIPHFRELSMGMSGDFRIAVEEGSTIVRVGSLIFGERVK